MAARVLPHGWISFEDVNPFAFQPRHSRCQVRDAEGPMINDMSPILTDESFTLILCRNLQRLKLERNCLVNPLFPSSRLNSSQILT
jgi:hypothetical protein